MRQSTIDSSSSRLLISEYDCNNMRMEELSRWTMRYSFRFISKIGDRASFIGFVRMLYQQCRSKSSQFMSKITNFRFLILIREFKNERFYCMDLSFFWFCHQFVVTVVLCNFNPFEANIHIVSIAERFTAIVCSKFKCWTFNIHRFFSVWKWLRYVILKVLRNCVYNAVILKSLSLD